jgi:hypothetical protein
VGQNYLDEGRDAMQRWMPTLEPSLLGGIPAPVPTIDAALRAVPGLLGGAEWSPRPHAGRGTQRARTPGPSTPKATLGGAFPSPPAADGPKRVRDTVPAKPVETRPGKNLTTSAWGPLVTMNL